MRRIAAIVLLLVLSINGIAIAESCPLPKPNIKKLISLSGFRWYSDYDTTILAAAKKGIVNQFDWARDHFDDDGCLTPHWQILYENVNSFAGSEERCGGYLSFHDDLPDIAGYKVNTLNLYMMWNTKVDGFHYEYNKPGAVQLYMAKYELDVADNQACYNDLVMKLKSKYGDDPYSDVNGSNKPTYYTYWVNKKHGLVGVSYNEYSVNIVYMAPGAEKKLVDVEKKVAKYEIKDAAGDLSGL